MDGGCCRQAERVRGTIVQMLSCECKPYGFKVTGLQESDEY